MNPSGRLPVDVRAALGGQPRLTTATIPTPGTKRVVYKEGVFVGYRGYEHNGDKPLFPFGYGLSYTTFKYANLAVTPDAGARRLDRTRSSFDVTNTGTRAGADVAQVYVARAPRQGAAAGEGAEGLREGDASRPARRSA